MQRASFPKDGFVWAVGKLQLIHSDVCGPMQSFRNHLYFVTFIEMTFPGMHGCIL